MARRRSAADTSPEPDEEARIFHDAVRDVRPLAPTSMDHLAKPRKRLPRRAAAAAALELESGPLDAAHGGTSRDITPESVLTFHRPGVRPQVVRHLRRGLYPIDDELDLHGQSESAARDRLALFIAQSRDQGHRCVRVIHGKGYRSGAQGPVLKSAVNAWLRRHLDVLAFVSARVIDGGSGALYVLLRR